MIVDHPPFGTAALVLASVLLCTFPPPSFAAEAKASTKSATLSVVPGTLVRWSVPGTVRCRMSARSWAPLGDTCYFPIDLEQKPGVIAVARQGQGRIETARIAVEPRNYGTQEIELPDIAQANPSPADLKRNARERVLLGKVFNRKDSPARFTLPLGKPANPLPEGKSFGVDRIFNGKPAAQPHTGTDYPVPARAPVLAAADGTVILAQDLFYPGNAVFVDHGDGLVSMYFHLSDINVQAGQDVRKGDRVGQVGTTGRSTGPHLFFGIRWHDARINPRFVLEDPAKIPAISSR
ncbi:MAG: M23 family metallopeptidase [Pseudomonadota bacterium]|nr:M23 family metallopeptidase [Pseudomonadota bacterium]